jgi:hypothetical protein
MLRTPRVVLAPVLLATVTGCVSSTNDGGRAPDGGLSFDAGSLDSSLSLPDAGPPIDAAGSADGVTDAPPGGEAILVPSLGGGFDYHQGSYDLGWYFVVNTPITITALGFYDDLKDGLTASHPVGVYDKSTQALLAQATVSPSDPLTGYFRYTPLSPPLALQPGHSYVLVALVGSEKYLAFNQLDPAWTVSPAITYSGGAVNYGNPQATALGYPDTFGTSGGDFGPNFEFTSP